MADIWRERACTLSVEVSQYFCLYRERIFYMMEKKNMTQLELSKRTGIATSNISDWKKKKTNPKADSLLSICDALEITPEQLLTGKGIDPEYKHGLLSGFGM